jgi:hypothetical protein
MALVTLTALQALAMEVVITQVIDNLARYQMIKDYTDEQCQILIDNAKVTKEKLDERLADH